MANMTHRLAACVDAAAMATELRTYLRSLDDAEDHKAVLNDVVVFLTASEDRWIPVTMTFILYLSGEHVSDDEIVLKLLDALLVWITQETVAKTHKILRMLLQLFELAIRRLGTNRDMQRWLQWGDQVLAVIHQNAALVKNQELWNDAETIQKDSEGVKNYVATIATSLMQLRNKVAENDNVKPDLKIMTFVWKNLAKLATVFGPTIEMGAAAEKENATAFTIDELIVAVMASLECSVKQLMRALDRKAGGVLDVGVWKFFKLYWRAFQRIILAFRAVLECELENCVLVIVNVTACLLYATRHSRIPETSKLRQEFRALLDQALEIVVKLVFSADNATNCQKRLIIRTLLWHPVADMVRAIGQRQLSDTANSEVKRSIEWSHLLVLTAFSGSTGDVTDDNILYDDSNRAIEVTQLFARYRECALPDSNLRLIEMTELFMDLMLECCISFKNIAELQLALLKQTLYPDWRQRTMCWEIWRELLCFCWDETLAVQALQMLMDITQWDKSSSDESSMVSSRVIDDVLQLISFVFADLPLPLQDMCMDQVTAVIDVISSEGPGHDFNNLRVASQLHMLEKLASAHFLHSYNGPMKDEWVAKYLPICFECCGTILNLLSSEPKTPTTKHCNILGMIRVLDMCLLVLKGVLDDNEIQQDDIAELSVILVRMSAEAVSQLAAHCKQTESPQAVTSGLQLLTTTSVGLARVELRGNVQALETSLYILSKLGHVLKCNKNNQCVQVIKDLLTIIDSAQCAKQHGASNRDTLIITTRFVNATLFDLQVANSDKAVVWQLVLAVFQKLFASTRTSISGQMTQTALLLSEILDASYQFIAHSNVVDLPGISLQTLLANELQLFRQSVSMRKLAQKDVAKALDAAESSTLEFLKQSQSSCYRAYRNHFPDEPAELYPECDQSGNSSAVALPKRSAEHSEAWPQKRHKIAHFVSLCREIESVLSTMEDHDNTAATILSGKELEDATAVLHKLLAKTIVLGP